MEDHQQRKVLKFSSTPKQKVGRIFDGSKRVAEKGIRRKLEKVSELNEKEVLFEE